MRPPKPLMTFNQDEFLRGCLMEIACHGGTREARDHAINTAATYAGKFITDEIQKLSNKVTAELGEPFTLDNSPLLRLMWDAGAPISQIAATFRVSPHRIKGAVKRRGLKH